MIQIRRSQYSRVSDKLTPSQNRRRWYIHGRLRRHYNQDQINVVINSEMGIISLPVTIHDELNRKETPTIISKHFHELSDFGYMIQIALNQ